MPTNHPNRIWSLGLGVCAGLGWTTGARAQTVLFDGTFANPDWTHVVLFASPGAVLGPSGQVAAGGNPGAYQRSEHTLPGAFDTIYDGHLCVGCGTFDPATDGPVLSVKIEYDYIDLLDQIGFGTRNGLYVLQGGQHFIWQVDGGGPYSGWTQLSATGITATGSGWQRVTGSGVVGGAPNFSTNGAPMQFGYYTRNAPVPVRGDARGVFTQRWGVDDFRVTLCTPELCNNLDDDCDGEIDEGFEIEGLLPVGTVGLLPVGSTCYAPEGECFTQGRVTCSSNGLFAYCEYRPITPGVEGPPGDPSCCNFDDDDCDGLQDGEDPDCTMAELCDYCDNDGDGLVDEDFPNLDDICTVGVGLCKKTGFYNCATDGLGTVCSAQPYPPSTEGPPQTYRCQDGIDNDCDGLVDLEDPDCQEPEKCDGLDNDGDGDVDEDFPQLGGICLVGEGQCAAFGTVICRPDGEGTMCSASPGKGSPEGPVSCDCADGIDNDCDGLVDLDDPDCGGSQLAVRCALPATCGPIGDDCKSWHTVEFDAINGAGGESLTGTLLGLDTNGDVIAAIEVEPGDAVRLASRTAAGDFVATTTEVTLDLAYFAGWDGCMTGPNNGPYPAGCSAFDSDCDDDIDLVDHAALQVKFNQTLKYHELAAPTPLLYVQGEDGLRRAQAFCSNMPFVGMVEPDETVVVSSEGENISRIRVALPQIDPESLFLKIDGVDVFAALGLDPATDFPGGPFGGQVDLTPTGPGCVVDICDLRVELAPVGTLASHSLSMYVENYCCGGHIAVLTGAKLPGSLSDTPNPACHVDDLRDDGVAQVFEVFIHAPTDGQITPGGPTGVTGEVCHGRELVCPFSTICGPMVKLNGLYVPLAAPAITLGDGENSANTYVYPYTAVLQNTDLVQEVVNGIPVHGTLDPGSNRLIAEANDPLGNAAFENVMFAVGPVHVFSFRGGDGIDKGLNLAITPTGLQQVIEPVLQDLLEPIIQEIRQWLVDLDGEVFPIDVPGTSCDPDVTIDVDQGTINDLSIEQFTFSITPVLDKIDIVVTAPDASASAQLKGGCKIKVCSTLFPSLCWCLIKFTVNVTADATVTGVQVKVAVTEDDILTPGEIQPTLVFDENNVDINIAGVDIEAGCIGGFIIQLLHLEDEVEAILLVLAQYYIDNELDISQWMNFVNIPALEFDLLDLDDVDIAAAMLQLGFEKSEVHISPTGMAIGYKTTFTPAVVDPEVADIPGIPKTDAPLPVPFIPAADNVAVSIADDAINQLFHAMCVSGALITEFEDDTKTIDDLLPANCNTLAGEPTQQGACVGLRGGDCAALPNGPAEDTCENVSALSALMGIDASALLLLHGRVDVSPKLLMFDNPGTPATIEAALRLSQLSVGIVADRDGNGTFSAFYDSLPACTPFGLGADCALWEACLDIDFFTDLSLTMDGQVPVINTLVTSSVPSTGTMCSGGMGTPGNPFDDLAQSLVVQLLTDLVTDNTPPLRLEGLDFGGVVTLQNPRLIAIENDGDPDFDDYLAITADPVGD